MKGILLGGALAGGGALIGYLIGAGVDMTRKAAWWDVLTAVGTFGAVVVAVVLAIQDRIKYRREREIRNAESDLLAASRVWEATHVAYDMAGNLLFDQFVVSAEDRAAVARASANLVSVRSLSPAEFSLQAFDISGLLSQMQYFMDYDWGDGETMSVEDVAARQSCFEDLRDAYLDISNVRDRIQAHLQSLTRKG